MFGLLAAGTALGVGELVAAFTGASTAPPLAVGTAAINLAPHAVKDFAIREFGTHDKLILVSGVLVVLAVLAVIAGILALRRLWWGVAIVAAFGVQGIALGDGWSDPERYRDLVVEALDQLAGSSGAVVVGHGAAAALAHRGILPDYP